MHRIYAKSTTHCCRKYAMILQSEKLFVLFLVHFFFVYFFFSMMHTTTTPNGIVIVNIFSQFTCFCVCVCVSFNGVLFKWSSMVHIVNALYEQTLTEWRWREERLHRMNCIARINVCKNWNRLKKFIRPKIKMSQNIYVHYLWSFFSTSFFSRFRPKTQIILPNFIHEKKKMWKSVDTFWHRKIFVEPNKCWWIHKISINWNVKWKSET